MHTPTATAHERDKTCKSVCGTSAITGFPSKGILKLFVLQHNR